MNNDYFMGAQMPYRGAGYAPSYLSTQLPQGVGSNIVWTMGLESAKAYPLLPGRTMLLMDSETPRFFIKNVDTNGYATLKAYSFQEESIAPAAKGESKYVTKEELEAAMAAVIEQMRQKASPAATSSTEIETEKTKTKNLL